MQARIVATERDELFEVLAQSVGVGPIKRVELWIRLVLCTQLVSRVDARQSGQNQEHGRGNAIEIESVVTDETGACVVVVEEMEDHAVCWVSGTIVCQNRFHCVAHWRNASEGIAPGPTSEFVSPVVGGIKSVGDVIG